MPPKKPTISLADDDFGAILNCAVRYSLGRMTYAPHDVMRFCRPLLPILSNRTLWVMEKDIATAARDKMLGDENIDAPAWLAFLTDVQEEITRRKNNHA